MELVEKMSTKLTADITQWHSYMVIRCNCGHNSDQHKMSIEDDVISGIATEGCTVCNCKQVYNPEWKVQDIKFKED